jgi:hypothetical protein
MHQLALVLQSPANMAMAHRIASIVLIAIPIIVVVFYAIVIVPFWFICKKAGFSPWLSLLNLVPLGGIILMYVLAFADWNVAPVAQPEWQPIQPPYPPQPPLPPVSPPS